MDTTDDDKRAAAKRRAAELDAELTGKRSGSMLPNDPSLPPDAQALRAKYATPLERLIAHAAGEDVYDGDMSRLAADGKALPYTARQPAARQEVVIDSAERDRSIRDQVLALLRSGEASPEDVKRMAPSATRH